MCEFEWDPAKSASNLRKHGIDFALASTVFQDPIAITILDHEHHVAEERWIIMGLSRDNRVIVVSHTWTEIADGRVTVRLISARPATRRERYKYETDE